MFRARERGMSFWPFAISLLLLIVMVVLWFSSSSERDQAIRERDAAKKAATDMEKERNDAKSDLHKMSKIVGFIGENGLDSKPELIEAGVKSAIAKWREKAQIEIKTFKYTAAEGGGKIEATEGDTYKVGYVGIEGTGEPSTLEGLLPFAEQGFARMKFDIDRAFTELGNKNQAYDAMQTAHTQALKDKDDRIAALQAEKQASETAAQARQQELSDRVSGLENQKNSLESEKEQITQQAAAAATKFLSQINDLNGQIRTLVQREAPTLSEGPDGEVLVGADGLVVINRGKRDFLMPGTVFSVLGRAKGGALYPKGTVKVTNCDEESARCVVLEQASAGDPIGQGDLVQSQTYSPNRKLHFVLVGEFRKLGRSMIETRLKQLGAIVDDRVTSETNYVVEGAPKDASENLEESEPVKRAHELGIRILTEEQLESFTRI